MEDELKYLLIKATIVILAKNHNPSIVTKEWLSEKRIIDEKVINFVHTPPFSMVETEDFNLIIDQNRLEILIKKDVLKNLERLKEITKSYIKNLPETPYYSTGFNFIYHVTSRKMELKDIFSIDDRKIKRILSDEYKLGINFSFKIKKLILNFSIQPLDNELIINFNFSLKSNKITEILEEIDNLLFQM